MTTPSPSGGAPAGQPTPWILVVDDEPSMRALIEIVLRGQGWDVRTAEGGEDALEILRGSDHPPAFLISDVLMPGMSGLDLVRKICEKTRNLDVLFISGHLTDVSWWPNDLRAHRFLAKPFVNAQLVAIVRDALGEGSPAA